MKKLIISLAFFAFAHIAFMQTYNYNSTTKTLVISGSGPSSAPVTLTAKITTGNPVPGSSELFSGVDILTVKDINAVQGGPSILYADGVSTITKLENSVLEMYNDSMGGGTTYNAFYIDANSTYTGYARGGVFTTNDYMNNQGTINMYSRQYKGSGSVGSIYIANQSYTYGVQMAGDYGGAGNVYIHPTDTVVNHGILKYSGAAITSLTVSGVYTLSAPGTTAYDLRGIENTNDDITMTMSGSIIINAPSATVTGARAKNFTGVNDFSGTISLNGTTATGIYSGGTIDNMTVGNISAIATTGTAKQDLGKAFDCYKKLIERKDDNGEKLINSLANKYYEPAIDWVLQNSKKSDQILKIAKLYLQGKGVKKNEKKAFDLIKKISDNNYEAMYTLAGLYEKGIGCPADVKLCVETLKKAAENGYPSAAYDLGTFYKDGKYVEKNDKEAKKYFDMVLKSGLGKDLKSQAAFYVGEMLMKSDSQTTTPNLQAAEQYFYTSYQLKKNLDAWANYCIASYFSGERVSFSDFAKSENTMALYRYGYELYCDNNTIKNSFQYFSKAAEKGLIMAKYYLAKLYSDGKAIEKDENKANELFKEAFENKDSWPQKWTNEYHLFLADAYDNALGCKEDKAKAYEEYLFLAKKGLIYAQYKVAEYLRDGIGVKKDPKEALSWFYTIYKKNKKAREAYEIGKLCIGGELGGIDPEQALNYFKSACYDEAYCERAYFEIGKIYFYGIGKNIDYNSAFQEFKHIKNIPEAEVLRGISRENGCEYQSYIGDIRKENFPVYKKYVQQFPMAKFRLARAYKYGYGAPRDLQKAAELFAELPNDDDATYELAMMYFDGLGVEQNDAKAYELFNKAKSGSLRAEYRAAICLMQGIGCEKDEAKAAEAFKALLPKLKAISGYHTKYQKIHYSEVLYMISQIYRNGWGVNRDMNVVKECIDKSMYQYINFYYDKALDFELAGNLDVAKLAYEEAAKKGVPMAFVRLAAMTGNNANVRNSLLNKAVELGCRDAYLIKNGKMKLPPFGRVAQNSSNPSSAIQGNSSLQKVNNALQNISSGLKQFNELFK